MTRLLVKDDREIKRRGRYEARLNAPDGEIIVESSRQPLLAAARVLKGRGVRGWLEMWGGIKPSLRMSGNIDVLATLTIRENRQRGPELARWKADSRYGIASPAAGNDPAGG